MSRYGKYLGPKLKKKVEEFLEGEDFQKLTKINDEIALSRALLSDNIVLYEAAHMGTEERSKILAGECLKSSINHVAGLCMSASRIAKDTADRVTVEQLNSFVMQMTKLINDEVTDEVQRSKIMKGLDNLRLTTNSDDPELQAARVRDTLKEMEDATNTA